MTEAQVLAYVHASAALQGLPLDAARAKAVAQHLQHTAQMAQLLDGAPLSPEDEIAEVYRPAAFPSLPKVCA